jgi:predicted nucleic acid-binding protein
MSPIVSNATPLIYLAKAGRLGLLRSVFGEVFIPEEVKVEGIDMGKRVGETDAYKLEKGVEDGWLKVLRAEPLEIPIRLDPGEVAAFPWQGSLESARFW